MGDICGHKLEVADLSELSGITTSKCRRETWEDYDYCIWHTDCDGKPVSKLLTEINSGPDRIDAPILRNIDFPSDVSFKNMRLFCADFSGSELVGADFSKADLHYADFSSTNLNYAQFKEDTVAKEADFSHSKCLNSDFTGASLRKADFSKAYLPSVIFQSAELMEASFEYAEMLDGRLEDTNLRAANLSHCDLSGTTLRRANLENANFFHADIRNATFVNARTYKTDFRDVPANHQTDFGDQCIYEFEADRAAEGDYSVSPQENSPSRYKDIENNLVRFYTRFRSRGVDSEDQDKLEMAIHVYRNYRRIFEENPVPEFARRYRIAEKDCIRKKSLRDGPLHAWFKWSVLRGIMGYGEKPTNVLIFGGLIIFGMVPLYLFTGIQSENGLVYSFCYNCDIISLDTVQAILISVQMSAGQFFPSSSPSLYPLGGGKLIASIESAIGTLLISIFVYVLGRRAAA